MCQAHIKISASVGFLPNKHALIQNIKNGGRLIVELCRVGGITVGPLSPFIAKQWCAVCTFSTYPKHADIELTIFPPSLLPLLSFLLSTATSLVRFPLFSDNSMHR